MTGFKDSILAEVASAIDAGLTISQACAATGHCRYTLAKYADFLGASFRQGARGRKPAPFKVRYQPRLSEEARAAARRAAGDRAEAMALLYRQGKTLEQIGSQYGITRERVRQVIKAHFGLTGQDGGASIAVGRARVSRQASRDDDFLRRHGCTVAQYRLLRQIGNDMRASGAGPYQPPLRAYHQQKHNAKQRGIGWELTLWQWWKIWDDSGHWERRGRGQGYVMARYGDSGPYAVGNVEIIPAAINCSLANNKSDLPCCGVRRANKREYEASRQIDGIRKKLGRFPTPEQAHAAYLAAGA